MSRGNQWFFNQLDCIIATSLFRLVWLWLIEGILKKFSQQNQVENVFLSQKSQVHRKGGNRLVYVYASQATFHQTSKKVGIHI
jgi:hypothetical protein